MRSGALQLLAVVAPFRLVAGFDGDFGEETIQAVRPAAAATCARHASSAGGDSPGAASTTGIRRLTPALTELSCGDRLQCQSFLRHAHLVLKVRNHDSRPMAESRHGGFGSLMVTHRQSLRLKVNHFPEVGLIERRAR